MNKALLLCFLLVSMVTYAQTSETKYYRSRPFEEEVSKEKAKYSETITEENGIVTTTVTNLKKNQIESRYRGDEPVGKWIGLTGTGPEELDFDFVMQYGKNNCVNPESMSSIQDFFSDNSAVSYIAPVVDYKDPQLMTFLRHKLRYPAKARRTGVQGTVHLAFTITTEATIQDIIVTEGVDISLDKEAVRVIRALKLSNPALLNGKPQEVCVHMPLRFKLN